MQVKNVVASAAAVLTLAGGTAATVAATAGAGAAQVPVAQRYGPGHHHGSGLVAGGVEQLGPAHVLAAGTPGNGMYYHS
jgi:hypothetical protein